ncbi:MAG: putative toxin-antitoxin system toxin component, PIN family [Chthonomonadales bacterium]
MEVGNSPYYFRVVFDCNIFLQAAIRDTGPSFACLAAAEAGSIELFITPQIVVEIESVFSRPKVKKSFPLLTTQYAKAFLQQVNAFTTTFIDIPTVIQYPRDPKDEPYINLAIACRADYLVTWDNDLLDLMKTSDHSGPTLLEDYPRLSIINPPGMLERLREMY